ncbi:MAG: CYTH and CHAD domain-containing protein [Pseudomonadota bacterium]
MDGTEREFEIKLTVDARGAAMLAARLSARGYAPRRQARVHQVSTYFDTDDGDLRARGLALRIRTAGRRIEQTVKANPVTGPGITAGLSNPIEHTSVLNTDWPDAQRIDADILRHSVASAIADKGLHPTVTTDVVRLIRPLWSANGSVEAALDDGAIHAGDRSVAVLELEIEAKDCPPDPVFQWARTLAGDLPFALSTHNKAEQGFALFDGALEPLDTPVRLERTAAKPDASAATTGTKLLSALAPAIAQNHFALQTGTLPEGPHQFRVTLRRLRAVLKALQPIMRKSVARHLEDHARSLARLAGPLRDADVLIDEIVAPVYREHGHHSAIADLLRRLEERRDRLRNHVRHELCAARTGELVVDLSELAASQDWIRRSNRTDPPTIADIAPGVLDREWKRVNRRARGLADLDTEQRHALRRAVKRLRYVSEIMAAVADPGRTAVFIRQTRKLQNAFGTLNDLALAETLRDDASGLRIGAAVDHVIGWHATRADAAWGKVEKRWTALDEAGPFWK